MIFNGTYTVQNTKTGEHRTFRISTVERKKGGRPWRKVEVLVGSDNTRDYRGFAQVGERDIIVWRRVTAFGNTPAPARPNAYDWYADMLNALLYKRPSRYGKGLYQEYTVMVEKRCLDCNRKLTHPESLISGYGPECVKRHMKKAA